MLYLTGIIITFFLAVILIGKKNKSDADHVLTIWLICLGLHLTLFYLIFTGKYIDFPYFLGVEIPMPLVHGPLLYLYVSSLTHQIVYKPHRLIHFLPALITYLFLIPFYILPIAQKILVYQNNGLDFEMLLSPIRIITMISGVVYTVLSLIKVYRHKRNITNKFSNTEKINLSWLLYLIMGIAFIWLVVIFGIDEYIFATVVLFVFFIGYFGIKQVGVFTSRQEDILIAPLITTEKNKYTKSGLTEDSINDIYQELSALMQKEKLYTDPEITLLQLSKELDIHPNYLSQVINTIEQKNFYDYINIQRIEEFKRIADLPGNRKFTLLSLAYECGFNSKTSFNRNFKKQTGISPSEYLEQKRSPD